MCEDMGGGSSGRGKVLTQALWFKKTLYIYIYISWGLHFRKGYTAKELKKLIVTFEIYDTIKNHRICTYT